MQILKYILITITVIFIISYFILLCRTKKPFKSFLFISLSGIIAMALINLTTRFTGTQIPVNFYSVAVSSGLGITGVTALLILKLLII